MSARLASAMLVSAMLRRASHGGGFGTVVWRGDDEAGGLLLICCDRGAQQALLELGRDHVGRACWRTVGPATELDREAYLESRRRHDRDLWLVELDIPDAARFAAETINAG